MRTIEMALFNSEINLILTWFDIFLWTNDTKATTFALWDTKFYIPVVTSWTEDNAKLLEQSKSSLKRTISWNKYEPKVSTEAPNPYLDFLSNQRFQRENILFVSLFKNKEDRTVKTKYYPSLIEIKDHNVMIDRRNFFDEPVKNNLIIHHDLWKIATGQGDDNTTGCQLALIQKQYNKLILQEI